ncbi:unnamed protein product [Toxocara canis]|nr:unnamed protein product [Toxocara canis]
MEDHEKAVIVAMCVALVAEVIALVWVGITICACFCKKFIIHPLPVLALCIALFLCIAIGLFGSNFKDDIDVNPANDNVLKDVLESSKLGYSFYLTCGALAGAIIDIVVGSLTVMFSNLCL